MPRYIDADALQIGMMEMVSSGLYGLEDMIDAVIEAPTISPDEARGVGHWVGIDDFPHESWECDRCGCVVENTDDPWNYFHYCPNCGAKMKGVSDDG